MKTIDNYRHKATEQIYNKNVINFVSDFLGKKNVKNLEGNIPNPPTQPCL